MRSRNTLLALLLSVWTLLWAMATAPTFAIADAPKILVFGDSLSAGYGIDVNAGWVALLARKLTAQGYEYRVVNASVTGETTGGGRTRLAHALQMHRPQIVVLELGANDGLRGLPVDQMRVNLATMMSQIQAANARVLLVGMQIPPNYGPAYTGNFKEVFAKLGAQPNVALVPFLLDGVALDMSLIQADGLHPNALAQPKLLDNVWPVLQPLLKKKS